MKKKGLHARTENKIGFDSLPLCAKALCGQSDAWIWRQLLLGQFGRFSLPLSLFLQQQCSLAPFPAPLEQFPRTKFCPSKEPACAPRSACSPCGIHQCREPLLGQRESAHRMAGVCDNVMLQVHISKCLRLKKAASCHSSPVKCFEIFDYNI